MENEFPVHETRDKESPLFSPLREGIQGPGSKIRVLSVMKFSEREVSRQLAGVCHLLLRLLARDFDIPHPEAILIVSDLISERVDLKILRRD